MPLLPGKKNIGHNIEVEEQHGKPHKQALAIALNKAGVSKSKDGAFNLENDAQYLLRIQQKHGYATASKEQSRIAKQQKLTPEQERELILRWYALGGGQGARDAALPQPVPATPSAAHEQERRVAVAKHNAGMTESQDMMNHRPMNDGEESVDVSQLDKGDKFISSNGSVQTVRTVTKNQFGNFSVSCDRGMFTFKPGTRVKVVGQADDCMPVFELTPVPMPATDAEVKVGDKVHLGFGAKGGAGFNGTVTKIEGSTVHIKNDQGRTFAGPLKFVSTQSEDVEVSTKLAPVPPKPRPLNSVVMSQEEAKQAYRPKTMEELKKAFGKDDLSNRVTSLNTRFEQLLPKGTKVYHTSNGKEGTVHGPGQRPNTYMVQPDIEGAVPEEWDLRRTFARDADDVVTAYKGVVTSGKILLGGVGKRHESTPFLSKRDAADWADSAAETNEQAGRGPCKSSVVEVKVRRTKAIGDAALPKPVRVNPAPMVKTVPVSKRPVKDNFEEEGFDLPHGLPRPVQPHEDVRAGKDTGGKFTLGQKVKTPWGQAVVMAVPSVPSGPYVVNVDGARKQCYADEMTALKAGKDAALSGDDAKYAQRLMRETGSTYGEAAEAWLKFPKGDARQRFEHARAYLLQSVPVVAHDGDDEDDARDAVKILKVHGEGGDPYKLGYSNAFVRDVLAGKFGKTYGEILKYFKSHPANDEHIGFEKLEHSLAHKKGVNDPKAVAAAIGRKKYGAAGMAKKAAAGRAKDEKPKRLRIASVYKGHSIWEVETAGGAIRYQPEPQGGGVVGLYPSVDDVKKDIDKANEMFYRTVKDGKAKDIDIGATLRTLRAELERAERMEHASTGAEQITWRDKCASLKRRIGVLEELKEAQPVLEYV